MKRSEFIKYASSVAIVLAGGEILHANDLNWNEWEKSKKVKLRFVVASDGHYGQKGTEYEKYFETLVTRINEEHNANPEDMNLIKIVDTEDEVVEALDNFYKKYNLSPNF
jgi:hypothetical protein